MTNYLQQEIDQEHLSSIESEILTLQRQEKEQSLKIEDLEDTIKTAQQQIEESKESYSLLKKDFETHGGLIKEERETLNRQVLEIEAHRKANSEKVREFIQTLLPFYLNKNLLLSTKNQLQNEEKLSLANQLTSELTEERALELAKSLPGVSAPNDLAAELRKQIFNIIKPNDTDVEYIHRVSPTQRTQFEVAAQQVERESHDTYMQLLQENRENLLQAQELRKKISTNDSTNEFAQMLETMTQTQEKIFKLEKEEENLSILETRQETLEALKNTIDSKQNIVQQSNKTRNTFLIAQSIMKLSTEFQMLQHQKKLQQVQIEATKMLNKLMRKHQYISSLRIDSSTFEVTLYDNNRDHVAKETLSAGEKKFSYYH